MHSPESSPSKYGLDDDSARNSGRWRISSLMMRDRPLAVADPDVDVHAADQQPARRPLHRLDEVVVAGIGADESCSRATPNGWVPELISVSPRRSATVRSSSSVAAEVGAWPRLAFRTRR